MIKTFVKFKGESILLAASIIWGVAFVAQRAAMDYIGAYTFNGLRFLLGSIILLPVSLLMEKGPPDENKKKKSRTTIWTGLICGLILFSAATFQQLGIQITLSAGKAGFITGLYIILTPVLGIFIGKKTGIPTWLGAAAALTGLYLLSAPDGLGSIGRGDLSLVACAFFWAAHILFISHYASRVYPIRFSITQFLVCSAASFVCAYFFEPESMNFGAIYSGRVPILFSSLVSVGIAYVLQIVGQRYVEPAKAALIFSMESLFAAIGAAVILNEFMNLRAYSGCALIFAWIIISLVRLGKKGSNISKPI